MGSLNRPTRDRRTARTQFPFHHPAAQGDGEVCGTAIESPMHTTVSVELIKVSPIRMPQIERPPARSGPGNEGRIRTKSGIGPDLHEAWRVAVSEIINLLGREGGPVPSDAQMLCSVASDLRIAQIVDAPSWSVTFHIPEATFA